MSFLENDNISIDNLDDFLKLVRLYAYCNYETSFMHPKIKQKNKDKLVEKTVEESMYLLKEDIFMDDVISLDQVKEITLPFLQKDPITKEYIVKDNNKICEIITKVTMAIVYRFCDALVNMGLAELAWDSKKNDFIFISKDKK